MIYGSKARTFGDGVVFLGFALALAGVACGEPSNNPNGISTEGSSAGRGGGTGGSIGGRGGSEAAEGGRAGSAGSADESSDAGPAGSGGATGSGGSRERPEGCPEPNPIPVEGQAIVIQSINVNTNEIVLRNATATPQSITLGRAGWQWCSFPRYWSFTDENATRELAPGETYSFIAINNQSPLQLLPEEGEMAIYPGVQLFDDYQAVQSFVAWGDIQAYRESYAVQKGVWTYEERIQIAPGHAGFIVTGETNRASGYTSAPARCLVP
jgi:hypothetical protein